MRKDKSKERFSPIQSTEFLACPTNLSLFIKDLAQKAEAKQVSKFSGKNFIQKKYKDFLLALEAQQYEKIYNFIRNFTKPELKKTSWQNIKLLVKNLEEVFGQTSLNNILLNYWLQYDSKYKKEIKLEVITKNEQIIALLKDFSDKKLTLKQLKKEIGFFAINPFELSNPRLSELSERQAKNIAKTVNGFKIPKKIALDKYLLKPEREMISIYTAFREELRWLAMILVGLLREQFLIIAGMMVKEKLIKKTNDIFDLNFQQIKKIQNEIQF